METISMAIGHGETLARMTASEAANHTAKLVEEFGRQVMEVIDRHRESGTAAAGAPMLTMSPSCRGCGMSVERAGDLCATCAEKPQYRGYAGGAPQATIEVGKQPEPEYKDVPATTVAR